MTQFYKVTLVNVLVLSLVTIGFMYGLIQPIFLNDASKLSYLMTAFMVSIAITSEYVVIIDEWDFTNRRLIDFEWFSSRFPFMGIVGTLLALGNTLTALGDGTTAQLATNIPIALISMKTLVYCTILGISYMLWTDSIIKCIDREE